MTRDIFDPHRSRDRTQRQPERWPYAADISHLPQAIADRSKQTRG